MTIDLSSFLSPYFFFDSLPAEKDVVLLIAAIPYDMKQGSRVFISCILLDIT
ncbi:MAG: hypothetical protein GXZ01_09450 [Clostridiaceae bacterium]|nr:hypothetical protein [Clostridiaceae bacterium]